MKSLTTRFGAAAALVSALACHDEPLDNRVDITPPGIMSVESTVLLDEIDYPPQRLSSPPIEYPKAMHESGIEGKVIVAGTVGIDGTVEEGSVGVVSSTHDAFERPAIRLLARSRFTPGRDEGQPVRVRIQMPVTFTIGN